MNLNLLATTSIEFPNLHISLNNLPKSFSLFGVDIAFYGVIIAFGMLAGIALVCYDAKSSGQDYNLYIDFAMYAIILSVIGARLYYVVFSWDYYSAHPLEIINIREGGLAIYGGVIAGIITCIVYTKIKKISFFKVADSVVLGLILGQMMRIFFDDNYSINQVPDAVRIGMENLKGMDLSEIGYIQVQPTFLYESVWNLMVLILMLIFRKKKKFDGEVFLWYLFGYGIGRFVIEGFRSDQLIMPVTGWPVSQALSLVLAVVAAVVVVVKRVKISRQEKMA